MNLRSRLTSFLASVTEEPRRRGAEALFFTGHVGARDRLSSALYFHLTAGDWAHRAHTAGYVDSLHVGLDRCRVPTSVLDLGTGGGGSAAALADRFPQARVIGVDSSRRMLRGARRGFQRPNLRFVRASVTSLPFADDAFDLIVWFNAIPFPEEVDRVAGPTAELLGVSDFASPAPATSPWAQRWHDVGFERSVADDLDGSGVELFRRLASD